MPNPVPQTVEATLDMLGKVLSNTLGRKLIRLQCYEGLDVSSAVYEWNYSAQMIEIRIAEAAGTRDRSELEEGVFSERPRRCGSRSSAPSSSIRRRPRRRPA